MTKTYESNESKFFVPRACLSRETAANFVDKAAKDPRLQLWIESIEKRSQIPLEKVAEFMRSR